MKVYIAGPMTGIPQFNYPAFKALANVLRKQSFEVVSPAEMDDPAVQEASLASTDGSLDTIASHGYSWGEFLSRDVKMIADDGIKAVVVLPGWANSRGARLETFVAYLCGLPIVTAQDYGDSVALYEVPLLTLTKAWAQKPDISFHSSHTHKWTEEAGR